MVKELLLLLPLVVVVLSVGTEIELLEMDSFPAAIDERIAATNVDS